MKHKFFYFLTALIALISLMSAQVSADSLVPGFSFWTSERWSTRYVHISVLVTNTDTDGRCATGCEVRLTSQNAEIIGATPTAVFYDGRAYVSGLFRANRGISLEIAIYKNGTRISGMGMGVPRPEVE